jgi:hypothetical protein
MDLKEINSLLKKKNKIQSNLMSLEMDGKITYEQGSKLMDSITYPPKNACLKIKKVLKLHKLRHKGNWSKKDYLLVVEPQDYNKVLKLTPKNYMFEDNIVKYNKKKKLINVGYFFSDENGLAYSGSGSDDWWILNKSLVKWLKKVVKKGVTFINKHK